MTLVAGYENAGREVMKGAVGIEKTDETEETEDTALTAATVDTVELADDINDSNGIETHAKKAIGWMNIQRQGRFENGNMR